MARRKKVPLSRLVSQIKPVTTPAERFRGAAAALARVRGR